MQRGNQGIIVELSEHSSSFLISQEKSNLTMGTNLQLITLKNFDGLLDSKLIKQKLSSTREVTKHILMKL